MLNLFPILVLFLFVYIWRRQYKESNILKRFTPKEQKEIYDKIQECYERAFDEARRKYPIGKRLIGKTIILRNEVDIRLSSDPTLINDSYKVPTAKLSAGEEIKILGMDSSNYIVETKDIKKGYLFFENKEMDQRMEEQFVLSSELFDANLKKIADEYKLSDEELLHFKNLSMFNKRQ